MVPRYLDSRYRGKLNIQNPDIECPVIEAGCPDIESPIIEYPEIESLLLYVSISGHFLSGYWNMLFNAWKSRYPQAGVLFLKDPLLNSI